MANASYAARQPPAVEGEKPVRVLVTGFGPFLTRYPLNSSWEIASSLPALLPASPTNKTPIQITVHYEPIRVSYKNVVRVVPTLLDPAAHDIILHIGLAASRTFFGLEQGAHTRGYGATADVDGLTFPDSDAEGLFPAEEVPRVLRTGFDTEDVLGRWKEHLTHLASQASSGKDGLTSADVRTNPDAGNFLCGFLYANALAHFHRVNGGEGGESPVVFLHVPDLSNHGGREEGAARGRKVVVALVLALVESWRLKGVRRQGDGEGEGTQEDDGRNNE